jgi:hypothetical protein
MPKTGSASITRWWHALDVKVARRKAVVKARRGYYVPGA